MQDENYANLSINSINTSIPYRSDNVQLNSSTIVHGPQASDITSVERSEVNLSGCGNKKREVLRKSTSTAHHVCTIERLTRPSFSFLISRRGAAARSPSKINRVHLRLTLYLVLSVGRRHTRSRYPFTTRTWYPVYDNSRILVSSAYS